MAGFRIHGTVPDRDARHIRDQIPRSRLHFTDDDSFIPDSHMYFPPASYIEKMRI
jgi:hypothetical protein